MPLGLLAIAAVLVVSSGQASPPNVNVTTLAPSNGQTVSGNLTWTVTTEGSIQKVVFSVDGAAPSWTEWKSPYTYNGDGHTLNTTTLSNGSHTLSATAYGQYGNRSATTAVTVNVQNGSTGTPAPPPPPSGSVPQVTTAPAITGTSQVGKTLTVSQGTWSNSPTSYSVAWQRCDSSGGNCAAIAGATSYTYVATTTDVSSTLRAVVTASNTYGSGSATSAATPAIAATLGAPTSVTVPAISGTYTVGQTLTATKGTWANSPTSYAATWQRCNSSGGSCVSISGASGFTYTTVSADAGSTLRVAVTASNAVGSGVAVSAATPAIQSPSSGGGGSTGGPAWPDTTPPAFTPNRVATTVSEFNSIMSSLHAGDVVEVKPMTLSGEIVFGQKLSSPAAIHFDPGVSFTGAAAGTQLPAVWIHGSNLQLYGGDVTGLGNDCVRVSSGSGDSSGPTNIRWWGAKLHGCGGTGFSAQGVTYPNSGLDISMEIWNTGQNLSLDPHAVKGTGLHGAYLGGGSTPTSGRFVFYVHDQATGAALQAGANLQNSDIWLRASNLTWSGTAGMAGNAFQPWGGSDKNVVVRDLEVSNATGYAMYDSSLTGGSGNVVQYARSTGVKMTPTYQSSSYITCQDCK